MKIEKVSIFGFAESKETEKEYLDTVQTAKILAENGYVVINGGGPGIMKAATVGAKAGGGKAIGVTLHPLPDDHMLRFEGRDSGNTFDEEIVTSNYVERTLKLIELGDVFVIMNGGTGTVSEFAMSWAIARLHFGCHKHLILYGGWWHNIMETFAANMHIRDEELMVYHIVDEPHEVLDRIKMIETLPDHC